MALEDAAISAVREDRTRQRAGRHPVWRLVPNYYGVSDRPSGARGSWPARPPVLPMTDRAPFDATPGARTERGRDGRGRRGFGHSQDRRHVVMAEAELIRDAARRVLDGETLVSIVDEWNRTRVRTTAGGPWHINALSSLLIQPRLTPSILDQATHDRLVALRKARQRSGSPTATPSRRYLLTGFLRCWRCGSRLNATARFGASAQPCYRCPSRGAGGCSGVIIRADLAERAAGEAVLDRVDGPEFAAWLMCQEARLAEEEQALTALLADALTGRATDVEGTDLWFDGRIEGQTWRELRARVEKWVNSRPEGLTCRRLLVRQQQLRGRGVILAGTWEDMRLEDRRSVIEAVVDHFVVWPAARPRNAFKSDRLKPVWKSVTP